MGPPNLAGGTRGGRPQAGLDRREAEAHVGGVGEEAPGVGEEAPGVGEVVPAHAPRSSAFGLRARRTNMKLSTAGVVQSGSSAAVKVDDKYAFMAKATPAGDAGAADAAWDD